MADFIDISPKEMWDCIRPYVREEWNFDDLARPAISRTFKHAIKLVLTGHLGNNGRSESFVTGAYNSKWIARKPSDRVNDGGVVPATWNGQRFVVNGCGLRRLQTLRMMRLISRLQPASVLDVGCGNGERLLQLACRFPDVRFAGLELTPGGVLTAKSAQTLSTLAPPLVEFSPEALIDLTAHRRIGFVCGSAQAMPFRDATFDLIYSSCALEQMERMRAKVLREVFRVTKRYAAFYEAFQDFNRGLLQRAYIYSERFFRGTLADLKETGFGRIQAATDLPQKVWMNNVHVLAEK